MNVVSYCADRFICSFTSSISFLQTKHFEISIYSLRQGNYNNCETYSILSTVLIKSQSPDENSGAGQDEGLPAARHMVLQRKKKENAIIQEF